MANPWTGEVALTLDGVPHVAKLTLGALAELEAGLGTGTLVELVERFESGRFSTRDVLMLIVAGLRGGGWKGTAADLIKRMREGKIYKGERIARALENFFQPERILQLRDLALRQVASQIERKIEKSLPPKGRMPIERFMGCISTNYEGGKKIIRKTARLAGHYQAEWYVLYVQTSRESTEKIGLKEQRKLIGNFKLAREMGGEVLSISAENAPRGIAGKALELDITNIVIGRPDFSIWRQVAGRNFLIRLLKYLRGTEIDIIIVF